MDTLCDRWWSDTLTAIDGAPAKVAVIMLERTESPFRLLLDRRCWLLERDDEGRIVVDAN